MPCFGRRELRDHAVRVLRGKLSALNRKTCEPIAREAGVARKPLQTFVGAGTRDDEAVMGELRRHVTKEFHNPDATFVVDGSDFPKKGTRSCGVQRQWCGRLGKVDNCQVGVFLACVSGGRAAPRGPHAVPAARVGRGPCAPPAVSHADDEFGRVVAFRARLRAMKQCYVPDVPCNTLVRVPTEPMGQPPKTGEPK